MAKAYDQLALTIQLAEAIHLSLCVLVHRSLPLWSLARAKAVENVDAITFAYAKDRRFAVAVVL